MIIEEGALCSRCYKKLELFDGKTSLITLLSITPKERGNLKSKADRMVKRVSTECGIDANQNPSDLREVHQLQQ
jgi:hypothetical protein